MLKPLFALLALTGGAHAQSHAAIDFAASNVINALFHEFGHAAIDQFQLPVLGQEEDAADSFAAVQIIQTYHAQDAMDILTDVALAGFIAQETAEEEGVLTYYGEHDLDAQRAYRAICHLYGADPDLFEDAAIWAQLPARRRESCEYDAGLAFDSWAALLAGLEPTAASPDHIIDIVYEPHSLTALLQELEVMEEVADVMAETLDWPRVITLRAAACGVSNAYYDPGPVEVLLCYEFLEELLTLDF